MPRDNKRRLPGIDGRYEFTMRFLRRTLHRIKGMQARLAALEAEVINLTRLAGELEKMARAGTQPDPVAAVGEFMEFSAWLYDYCQELRELLDAPAVRVLVIKVPGGLPPEPSVN